MQHLHSNALSRLAIVIHNAPAYYTIALQVEDQIRKMLRGLQGEDCRRVSLTILAVRSAHVATALYIKIVSTGADALDGESTLSARDGHVGWSRTVIFAYQYDASFRQRIVRAGADYAPGNGADLFVSAPCTLS